MSAPAVDTPAPTTCTAEPAGPRAAGPRTAILVLASCGLNVALIQTMVVPLLPRFATLMDVSPSTATWLVTATLVAGAVSAPMLGRLGDMYGKRRMLLISLGLVVAGSVLGAVAPNILVLLVGRVLQGVSFGVIALGMSLMRDVLPADKVGSGVGLMSSSLGVGGAVGLPLTGLVADVASWRWLFAGVAVVALVQVFLVRAVVGESQVRTGGRFDLAGALGLSIALVCLLLAVSKGSQWGWTSPTVLGLIGATLLILPVWGRHQLRSHAPLVNLRVSARRPVLMTNLATVFVGFSMFAAFMVTVQMLQAPVETGYGAGMSLLSAGVVLLPLGGSMLVFSSTSALISRVRGPRTTLVLGATLLAAGSLGCALSSGSVAVLVGMATVGSIGVTLAYSALPLLIMRAVPASETAAANSLNTLMRQFGTSICSAVVAALSTAFVLDLDGATMPSGTGYTVMFVIAAAVAVLGGVIGALTPTPEGVDEPRAQAVAVAG